MEPMKQQLVNDWSSIWSAGVRWECNNVFDVRWMGGGRILIEAFDVDKLCDNDRRWLFVHWVLVNGERSRRLTVGLDVWVWLAVGESDGQRGFDSVWLRLMEIVVCEDEFDEEDVCDCVGGIESDGMIVGRMDNTGWTNRRGIGACDIDGAK